MSAYCLNRSAISAKSFIPLTLSEFLAWFEIKVEAMLGAAMARHTVTRAELTEVIYQEVGLSRDESAGLVASVLDRIAEALTRGKTVKISSFGSFSVRDKAERVGRNPKTGEEVPILKRRVVVFRASHVLKDRINTNLEDVKASRAGMS